MAKIENAGCSMPDSSAFAQATADKRCRMLDRRWRVGGYRWWSFEID
ncbi:MAG: hypothetical protein ACYST6_02005 [Planctomycetota bacterium]